MRNQCLPIVGAGFSRNASTEPGKQLPLWDDLGKVLAASLEDYQYTNPIDAISAYAFQFSQSKLIEQMSQLLLVNSAQPGPAHIAFCNLQFDVVVTTNFDFLLEEGYRMVPNYCRPIVSEDQLSIAPEKVAVTLLKLHGDLHHPERMIATEHDYDTFLNKYPLLATYTANLLITRTPLFIGCSLEDPDFRQLWHVITDRLGKLRRHAYALMVSTSPSSVARFHRRGANVINLPMNNKSRSEVYEGIFSELSRDSIRSQPKM